ncbi:MAG: hypothetical protein HQL41_00940 [Alphaproteobacteria bacterium]|nr:hypothetical protein [Alphaproteobacteria bacterium]
MPPDHLATIAAAAISIGWAFIGRLLYVLNLVRLGKRKSFMSMQTVWELGVAIGMGVVAGGIAEWLGLAGLPSAGFISATSYLGPQVIELMLAWGARRAGVDPDTGAQVNEEE